MPEHAASSDRGAYTPVFQSRFSKAYGRCFWGLSSGTSRSWQQQADPAVILSRITYLLMDLHKSCFLPPELPAHRCQRSFACCESSLTCPQLVTSQLTNKQFCRVFLPLWDGFEFWDARNARPQPSTHHFLPPELPAHRCQRSFACCESSLTCPQLVTSQLTNKQFCRSVLPLWDGFEFWDARNARPQPSTHHFLCIQVHPLTGL